MLNSSKAREIYWSVNEPLPRKNKKRSGREGRTDSYDRLTRQRRPPSGRWREGSTAACAFVYLHTPHIGIPEEPSVRRAERLEHATSNSGPRRNNNKGKQQGRARVPRSMFAMGEPWSTSFVPVSLRKRATRTLQSAAHSAFRGSADTSPQPPLPALQLSSEPPRLPRDAVFTLRLRDLTHP